MSEVEKLAREIRELLLMGFSFADYAAVLKIATTVEDKESRAAIVKFADMALSESRRRAEAFAKINCLITFARSSR